MFGHYSGVEHKLLVAVLSVLDVEGVGHQRVPVVKSVELRCDAVLILELLVEEQLRVELELEVVAAQMLHVVLDHNLDGLSCKIKIRQSVTNRTQTSESFMFVSCFV